jgi:hypothetical protein
LVSSLQRYLWALLQYWWLIVSGILLSGEQVLEVFFPRLRERLNRFISKARRQRALTMLAFAAVFLSGFLAWRDQDAARQRAEATSAALAAENADLRTRPEDNEIATLRAEVAALRSKNAPRHLTAEQKARMVETLQPWAGAYSLQVKYQPNSHEAVDYANDFLDVFNTLRWTVEDKQAIILAPGVPMSGLGIAFTEGAQGPTIFVSLLHDLGIPFERLESPDDPKRLVLWVSKPVE